MFMWCFASRYLSAPIYIYIYELEYTLIEKYDSYYEKPVYFTYWYFGPLGLGAEASPLQLGSKASPRHIPPTRSVKDPPKGSSILGGPGLPKWSQNGPKMVPCGKCTYQPDVNRTALLEEPVPGGQVNVENKYPGRPSTLVRKPHILGLLGLKNLKEQRIL